MLKIAEIFASVQGEGLRQGEPTLFVRLAGCDLRCTFCDTKAAWSGGKAMSAERVRDAVRRLRRRRPAAWVCLTGGEPLRQNIGPLADLLRADGLKVQVETNGTRFLRAAVDWYTISPKPPAYAFDPAFRARAREAKLVVTKRLAYARVRSLREALPPRTPVFLQPQSNEPWSAARAVRLLVRAAADGLPNVRLTCQLHKVLGIR
jgi:organic radical activating enzyme